VRCCCPKQWGRETGSRAERAEKRRWARCSVGINGKGLKEGLFEQTIVWPICRVSLHILSAWMRDLGVPGPEGRFAWTWVYSLGIRIIYCMDLGIPRCSAGVEVDRAGCRVGCRAGCRRRVGCMRLQPARRRVYASAACAAARARVCSLRGGAPSLRALCVRVLCTRKNSNGGAGVGGGGVGGGGVGGWQLAEELQRVRDRALAAEAEEAAARERAAQVSADVDRRAAAAAAGVTALQGDVGRVQGDVLRVQGDVATLQGDVGLVQAEARRLAEWTSAHAAAHAADAAYPRAFAGAADSRHDSAAYPRPRADPAAAASGLEAEEAPETAAASPTPARARDAPRDRRADADVAAAAGRRRASGDREAYARDGAAGGPGGGRGAGEYGGGGGGSRSAPRSRPGAGEARSSSEDSADEEAAALLRETRFRWARWICTRCRQDAQCHGVIKTPSPVS
jgi:hypothetical protein